MEIKDTILLPKTDFPLKGNLPKTEDSLLKHWEEINLYKKIRSSSKNRDKQFVLHLGPPFANNNIHIGHALTSVLKDIVVKSKQLAGYDSPLIPGWDCHGMPIEIFVAKKLGKRVSLKDPESIVAFRNECAAFATKWIDIQKTEFKRLGIQAEWDNPYLTMDPAYESDVVRELHKIFVGGNLYRDLKPVNWCPTCSTALAEAEIEHKLISSTAIYVKFPILVDTKNLGLSSEKEVSLVIWTTTPWSLSANQTLCVNPNEEYVWIDTFNNGILVVAEKLADTFIEKLGEDFKDFFKFNDNVCKLQGNRFVGTRYLHPYLPKEEWGEAYVTADSYVTTEVGTGCVHIAPDHGVDDFRVGQINNITPMNLMKDGGVYKEDVPFLKGKFVFKVEEEVLSLLGDNLLNKEKIEHQYPHCWRCKKPTLTRATHQWFISLDKNGLRPHVLEKIEQVNWVTEWGKTRITNMVKQRKDWCISRQRVWGTPCAIITCTNCGKPVKNKEVLLKIQEVIKESGGNAWWEKDVSYFLPDVYNCVCGHYNFKKSEDTIDVWIDSGVSHTVVLDNRLQIKQADLYLEGSDQYRGWFMSSMVTSIATNLQSPYKSVLSHGFVVDGKGRKMSKSLGNVVHPEKVIKKYGADVLRLWVSAAEYTNDVKISDTVLQGLVDSYRRIRNTLRFLLGNLQDYKPENHFVEEYLDKWALSRLCKLQEEVVTLYESYKFHLIYQKIHNFCAEDMSAFYLDIIKDRLYCEKEDSMKRRSAQTTLNYILESLVRLISPILSFTAEEVWQKMEDRPTKSVHLSEHIKLPTELVNDPELDNRWEDLKQFRKEAYKKIEELRSEKVIGSSLEAHVTLFVTEDEKKFLQKFHDLSSLFIVSTVKLSTYEKLIEDRVKVEKTSYQKCLRCWNHKTEVGMLANKNLCFRCSRVVLTLTT